MGKDNKPRKKWLVDILKTSGSKRKWICTGKNVRFDWKDTVTNTFLDRDLDKLENLPTRESFSHVPNNSLNDNQLRRFLHANIGRDWDELYSEILERIPERIRWNYLEKLFWYVDRNLEKRDDGLYKNKSSYNDVDYMTVNLVDNFYVDPETNKLSLFPYSNIKRYVARDGKKSIHYELTVHYDSETKIFVGQYYDLKGNLIEYKRDEDYNVVVANLKETNMFHRIKMSKGVSKMLGIKDKYIKIRDKFETDEI